MYVVVIKVMDKEKQTVCKNWEICNTKLECEVWLRQEIDRMWEVYKASGKQELYTEEHICEI
jgi:hypothetical protein